jgi:hypothetical protein
MQELAVVCFVGDVVMDDQAIIDVNDALHVVAGRLRRMSAAHRPGVGKVAHSICSLRRRLARKA